jgi:hypothetical protein
MNAVAALRLCNGLVLVGVVLTALETLVSRRDYAPGQILDWEVLKHSWAFALGQPIGPVLDSVLGYPGFIVLVGVQLLASVAGLWILLHGGWPTGLNWVVFVIVLLFNFRSGYGLDGGDQMTGNVLGALCLAGLLPDDRLARGAALWFLGLQATLSYVTAGLYKIAGRDWRNGRGLLGVLSTRTYGSPRLSAYLARRPGQALAAAWSVIAFESLFPLAILAGPKGALVFLGIGVVFHLANAAVMGLNNFLWAFTATYPAVHYCAERLQALLRG